MLLSDGALMEHRISLVGALGGLLAHAGRRLEPWYLSGVTGHDEGQGGKLRIIEFERIKGGKRFDTATPWFGDMMAHVGQEWRPL